MPVKKETEAKASEKKSAKKAATKKAVKKVVKASPVKPKSPAAKKSRYSVHHNGQIFFSADCYIKIKGRAAGAFVLPLSNQVIQYNVAGFIEMSDQAGLGRRTYKAPEFTLDGLFDLVLTRPAHVISA